MQTPVREQVLQALFAALAAGLAADGGAPIATIERNRRPPGQKFPAVYLVDGDADDDLTDEIGLERWTARVTIEGQVQGDDDQALTAARGLIEARIVKAAMADQSLGGLATLMTLDGITRDLDREGSPPTATVSLGLLIEYWTRPGDPYSAAP